MNRKRSPSIALVSALAAGVLASAGTDKVGIGEPGGKVCFGATQVSPPYSDFFDTGTTCGGTTIVSNYASSSCNSVSYPGPEVVYELEIVGDPFYLATIEPRTADLGLFLVTSCTLPTGCVDFHDAIGPGAVSQLPRFGSDLPPGTYYLFVDSYYATGAMSCGSYDFTLNWAPLKGAELIDFDIE